MVDYIIVGLGLAGISFCEKLKEENKTFIVFDDNSQQSSGVAGGMYNPVILKRFTKVWRAKEQLDLAIPFYKKLEKRFDTQFDYKTPVYRRFTSVEEQNLWFETADKPLLEEFMHPKIHTNENKCIDTEFGYGEVLQAGRVTIDKLQQLYFQSLHESGNIETISFDYDFLKLEKDHVSYKDITSKYIVFAEGFGLKKNPFFSYLPLNGTKGELLTIKAPDLKLDFILKSSVFIIPLNDDLYRIGATYEWNDKTNQATEKAKKELVEKLRSFLKCDFEIVDQQAGIRPTVIDRRPLVGQYPKSDQVYVLNGMGSRGVMIAPYISEQLFNHLENKEELDSEIDIKRFENKYFKG
ncbi:FAD-dependent oxidoreductase [Flavobacteriaceae bacterium R38]|nr:FAD-dependent oxidoreductase [Flavobacteriaceae bacterium R38]